MAITSPRHVSFISLVLFIFIGDVSPAPASSINGLSKKNQPLPLSINIPHAQQLPFDAITSFTNPSLLHPLHPRTSSSSKPPPGPLSLPSHSSSPELMPVAAVVSAVFAGILMTMVSAFAVWMCAIRHRHPTNNPSFLKNSRGGGDGGGGWGEKPELGSEGCERLEVEGAGKGRPELEGGIGKGGAELEGGMGWRGGGWGGGVGGRAEVGEGCERWEVEGDEGASELDDGCALRLRGELEGG
ncbi:hypothetical protein Q9189_004264 [Teloschistes chrysophthalmus]